MAETHGWTATCGVCGFSFSALSETHPELNPYPDGLYCPYCVGMKRHIQGFLVLQRTGNTLENNIIDIVRRYRRGEVGLTEMTELVNRKEEEFVRTADGSETSHVDKDATIRNLIKRVKELEEALKPFALRSHAVSLGSALGRITREDLLRAAEAYRI